MRTVSKLLIGLILAPSLAGCVIDPRYDFSKLDTEMTLMKGATFPVPSPDPIMLKDIIQLEGYDYIRVFNDGDYWINFQVNPVRLQLTVPPSFSGNRVPTDFVPTSFVFGQVPEFLSSDKQQVVPDLSNLHVYLDFSTDIPADFTVGTTLEAKKGGSVQESFRVDGLLIPSGYKQYCIREQAYGDPDVIEVPNLRKLIFPIPDEFRLSALDIFVEPDQLARVTPGVPYSFSCEPSVLCPIRFSAGTHFTVTIPLEAELNLNQIGLKKAVLYADVKNTIPLDFTMNLYALDAQGRRIESIRFSMPEDQRTVRGLESSFLSLELTTDGDLRFSSLVLELTASSSPRLELANFNENQGLTFGNMFLELPEGIVIKLDGTPKN